MAKKTTQTMTDVRYLSAEQAAAVLQISLADFLDLSGTTSTCPQARYGEGSTYLGYLESELLEFQARRIATQPQPQPQPVPEAQPLPREAELADPSVVRNRVSIPTTDAELARSLAFSRGFSFQWSSDELLRWQKLISGLVRDRATYLDYQQPQERRAVEVRSTIQSALKWLLRKAVPLTVEEARLIHLDGKMVEDEARA